MKDPPTGHLHPTIRPTERSPRHRHPPGAPPRSTVLCSGRGSSPLQRPIRQNSKGGKKIGVRSYHYRITNCYGKVKVKAKVAAALASLVATRSIRIEMKTNRSR